MNCSGAPVIQAARSRCEQGGDTPLHFACGKGYAMVRPLRDPGADTDRTCKQRGIGATSLHLSLSFACRSGHLDVVRLLMPRRPPRDHQTPPAARRHTHPGGEKDEEGKPKFPEKSKALLRKWHTLTPARRNVVLRLGWDYIGIPTKWTPQNYCQLTADFQQKVANRSGVAASDGSLEPGVGIWRSSWPRPPTP